jgi:SAM-dependent methyltransferase
MHQSITPVNTDVLRAAIRDEYDAVAREPTRGFHFHTGRAHAARLEYEPTWLEGIPNSAVDSFAGTGSPFRLGALAAGERVLDLGSGAGMDSLIASRMVGPDGRVVGIDMTQPAALAEMARVLGPNGRLQIADILVQRAVPENAKERIDLWTG